MKAKAERPPQDTVTTLILCSAEEKGNRWTMATASPVDYQQKKQLRLIKSDFFWKLTI